MSPLRLALRTLLQGHSRSLLAIGLIAASLCTLELHAGHQESLRLQHEHRAVIGHRLGHLAVQREAPDSATPRARMFSASEGALVQGLLRSIDGVALAVPQFRVKGIIAAGARSALFHGEGISGSHEHVLSLPGRLDPAGGVGVAVSTGQAAALGLGIGSKLTLNATSLETATAPAQAQVVDIYQGGAQAPILMPLPLAQTLQATAQIERYVIYLADPARSQELRDSIAQTLHSAGIPVRIQTWQEQSGASASPRGMALAFGGMAGMVLAIIAATVAATLSMNALQRSRELAALRALGMPRRSAFGMLLLEGLGMAVAGALASVLACALIAWIVNRAGLSFAGAGLGGGHQPALVELDFDRYVMAVLAAMAVALLASVVPAFKAARMPITSAL